MKIKIYGHSATHVLDEVATNTFKCIDSYYCRLIGDLGNIKAIDYDGGPMLSVGDFIDSNHKIESITDNGLIFVSSYSN